jgi:hypothetical protein
MLVIVARICAAVGVKSECIRREWIIPEVLKEFSHDAPNRNSFKRSGPPTEKPKR